MSSHAKALTKVQNVVKSKVKDVKGVKAKLPYKFLKNEGAKDGK